MEKKWQAIAQRLVTGLGVQSGELIAVRDGSGCFDLLLEVSLAIEKVGGTPLVQFLQGDYLERMWREVPVEILENWGHHRQNWARQIDRVLFMAGAQPERGQVPEAGLEAWEQAMHQLTEIEEGRRLPFLLAAVPTARGAAQLGLSAEDLEALLIPALSASIEELQVEINRVLAKARSGHSIKILTGDGYILHLEQGDRLWMSDDGFIDDVDIQRGAIVSNLPAGSIYTTVLEQKTNGQLWLPKAGPAKEVLFTFRDGRIVDIQASSGSALLTEELDRHSGEARRVSHIGLGLNPYLNRPSGWTMVDEHIHGSLFIALGENRYMGGSNPSSLNVDYALAGATLQVNDHLIVSKGVVLA
ncbi:MAG: aminopeptidase [Anaerolineales bacterium]